MEELKISILGLGCCLLVSVITAFIFVLKEIHDSRNQMRRDLQNHQYWLFNQLYSMSPGKVLKPDELIEETDSGPAEVIHTSRDPMNEFNGRKNDWF